MKLYVIHPKTGQKIYLNITAKDRQELAYKIESKNFTINNISFNVNDVYAEAENNNGLTGAIVGGLLGVMAGPIGMLIGTTAGYWLASEKYSEAGQVKHFNESKV